METALLDLLRTVSAGFQARMQAEITRGDTGLTPFQARLLNLIGRTPNRTQLDLVGLTERDKAQVARAVKELEAHGLVARVAHPSDWRSKCLTLTPSGAEIHAGLRALRAGLGETLLAPLSAAERQLLHDSLAKMAATLDA